MKSRKIRLLCTFLLNTKVIEQAAAQNVCVDALPFINTRPVVSENVFDAINKAASKQASVVITSANAAEAVISHLKNKALSPAWKIYCLEGNTLKTAGAFWSNEYISGTATNALLLSDKIIADKPSEVYFFCGNIRREDLPCKLTKQGITVNEVVVYETVATPHEIKGKYDGILFSSPSAVESFFTANSIDGTVLFAIGNTTAETLRNFSAGKIITSEFPDKEQLLDEAIKYLSC